MSGEHHESYEGRALSEIVDLARQAWLAIPVHVVLSIARGLCDSLEHLHAMPDTIRNRASIDLDHLVITDAGNVQLVVAGGGDASSSYLAPEVIRNETIDARSDLFAAGVVIWELLTGRSLFAAETDLLTIQNVLHGPIAAPSLWRPDCPQTFDTIVASLLARDPDLRPSSAAVLRKQIDAVIRGCATAGVTIDASHVAAWLTNVPLDRRAVRQLTPVTPSALDDEEITFTRQPTRAAARSRARSTGSVPTSRALPARAQTAMPLLPMHVERLEASLPAATPVAPPAPAQRSSRIARFVMVTVCALLVGALIAVITYLPTAEPASTSAATSSPAAQPARHAMPVEPFTPAAIDVLATTVDRDAKPYSMRITAPRRDRAIRSSPTASESSLELPASAQRISPPFRISPPSLLVPAPPPPVAPIAIRPDQVRHVTGQIAPLNARRLEAEGLMPSARVSVKLCIDERGAVTDSRFLTAVPSWLERAVAGDLRAFRFTPYVDGGVPRRACFARQLAVTGNR